MQLFNAKPNAVTIRLDNGTIMVVNPGEASTPFMGSVSVVTQVLSIGTEQELGLIINSSYEMDILRDRNASLAYVFSTVEAAKAKLLDGKDLTPTPTSIPIAEHEKVKKVLADVTTQRDELLKVVAGLEEKIKVAPSTKLNDEINEKSKQIGELNDKIRELEENLKNVTDDFHEARIAKEQLEAESKSLQAKVTELDAKVAELNAQLNEAGTGATQAIDPKDTPEYKELANELESTKEQVKSYQEVNERLGKENEGLQKSLGEKDSELTKLQGKIDELTANQSEDLKPKVAELEAENASLKEDGKIMFEQLQENKKSADSLKGMLKEVMDKFEITYVDGQFIKREN